VQALEAEIAILRERLNRNSRNSSRPPFSDGPDVPRKPHRRAKSGRKRGAQPGHEGMTRKLVPVERVKEVHDIKPDVCRRCGHELVGQDPEPYRHQVTEIPPVVAEVSEYRPHTLTCSECGAETRAKLPAGVPQSAFGPRLQAMVSPLSGRYHLSKRETTEIMADFFQADVSLGSVPALEQRTGEAIRVPVDEAREYVQAQPHGQYGRDRLARSQPASLAVGHGHPSGDRVSHPPKSGWESRQGDAGRGLPGHCGI